MKAFTSIEQSKKLAEILPIESADMWWAERYAGQVMANGQYIVEEKPVYYPSLTKPSNGNYSQDTVKDIPCWSIAALLDFLPNNQGRYTKSLYWFDDAWHCEYVDEDGAGILGTSADNVLDACYGMILKLYEFKIL